MIKSNDLLRTIDSATLAEISMKSALRDRAVVARSASKTVRSINIALEPPALYGLAGETVRILEPYTEADPAAILIYLLTTFGNVIGHVSVHNKLTILF